MPTSLTELPNYLLPWFDANKRDLPWRRDKDAYHVWLSEIMLQQTRVEAVKGYYLRFLDICPSIEALANTDDETLHKLWEGLGYYNRVRNLKKCAVQIMEQHGGSFPKTYEQVRALPGIGDYTSGAICSIAYNLPTPAVDGNVCRVMSRLLNDTRPIDLPAVKKDYTRILGTIYPENAGEFTQALMELGATVCGPNRTPECEKCPCNVLCQSFHAGTADSLPVKTPKKPRKTEDLTLFILNCNGKYAVEKRPDSGLLASLWQFPNMEGKLSTAQCMDAVEALGITPIQIHKILNREHIFTHILWRMQGVYLDVKNEGGSFTWLSETEINNTVALPTAFRQFWKEIEHV